MSNLMFIEKIEKIYKKPTNDVGGWSYAAKPRAKDSKFYKLNGEWFYVVKDRDELLYLRDQGIWKTSTNPNQLVSITDIYGVTKSIPMNNLVTTRVDDMSEMFYGRGQFNQYINNWDMSNNTSLYRFFRNAYNFNQPIGNWDVSNVTTMENMFSYTPAYNASFNQPIGNWDVSNVTTMENMFSGSVFNQPIGNWDVSNVVNMGGMFTVSYFNQPIGNWVVNNVTNMGDMFAYNGGFNQDLSSWCVSSVTDYTNFSTMTLSWTLPKPNFSNPPC